MYLGRVQLTGSRQIDLPEAEYWVSAPDNYQRTNIPVTDIKKRNRYEKL